jgi:hypothetical protein
MLSPQALIKGLVSRGIPPINQDGINQDVAMRQHAYGELMTMPVVRKQHTLADEGSYFVLHNNQTALTHGIPTSFAATAGFLMLVNLDVSRRMYLDYIKLQAVTAWTAASGTGPLMAALSVDNTLATRYTSGGSPITQAPLNVNMASASVSQVNCYAGALVLTTPSGAARTIVGQTMLRPAASATAVTVIGDQFLLNFGGVENASNGNITLTNPNIISCPLPPLVLGPQQTFMLHPWAAATTPAAGTWTFEVGYWLR